MSQSWKMWFFLQLIWYKLLICESSISCCYESSWCNKKVTSTGTMAFHAMAGPCFLVLIFLLRWRPVVHPVVNPAGTTVDGFVPSCISSTIIMSTQNSQAASHHVFAVSYNVAQLVWRWMFVDEKWNNFRLKVSSRNYLLLRPSVWSSSISVPEHVLIWMLLQLSWNGLLSGIIKFQRAWACLDGCWCVRSGNMKFLFVVDHGHSTWVGSSNCSESRLSWKFL